MTLIGRLRDNLSLRSLRSAPRTKVVGGGSTTSSQVVPPDVELDSASSSDIVSIDDGSLSTIYHDSDDPYFDVRHQLDELSLQDRKRHALHAKEINDTKRSDIPVPWLTAYTCYLGYVVMFVVGNIRDLCALVFGGRYCPPKPRYPSENRQVYASLLKSWEHFFACRIYTRVQDCFNRPIASNPGTTIQIVERVSHDGQKTMELCGNAQTNAQDFCTGQHFVTAYDGNVARECLNLGSYNYLGFADDWHETCSKDVLESLTKFPITTSSSLCDYGRTDLHRQAEEMVAKFVGKEDAMILNMGFNTNATVLPTLVGKGDLIVSDALNHNSLVNGARVSGAAIRTFRHNNMADLEDILREAIILGRPRMRRPWNKILVVVEGIYSMEGAYCDLKNVVRICKQYGAYVYLDEAHSIGAMGYTGRGCAEYAGVDPADIDIMMGTFTKSFGALGGYIASSKETIAFLRKRCPGSVHHNSMSPIVCQQVLSALKVISGEDDTLRGQRKLQSLRDNSNYFRMRLKEMGLIVLGQYDSPVVPVMMYNITKIGAFSRECFKRGLAVVVVGFPAVPLLMARARFCVSAGHTRNDLDRALHEIDEIADIVGIRFHERSKILHRA